MKTLKNLNFKGKKVLVRCDFDVPLDKEGKILDDFRIRQALPTIEYLIKKGAKVILMSHLGRPEGKTVENLRLTAVQDKLMEYLDLSITKAESCSGKEVEDWISQMRPGEILLLENLRFQKGEEENDDDFARNLSRLGDIYINDAFGTSHRSHASIALLPKYLISGAGLALEKEIKILSRVLDKPWQPLVAIIGGVKIETKIRVIEQFLEKANHLLLGGQIANVILEGKGIIIGRPPLETEILKRIEKIDLTNPKLHLPVDGLISLKSRGEDFFHQGAIGTVKQEEAVFDIGPETIEIFSQIIKGAKMIIWNGPLGLYEEEKFERGTREIAEIIVRNHQAFKIAGGGDTLAALNKFALADKFDHLSTGGGAMLDFLAGEKLPGIEALKFL